ncbi:hypothetical protein EST38_g5422 [Candolleomyces aberdarensis]|uniref:Sulfhydryl oxidase n=1 Tax=Candolleomyces aberdarensis TaxID=2316362 RepID=A0A4Q2DKG9_9AGAR|nr:hypothetical protein EST38_g5422 [Candolleomyces aberdarensis]
MLTLPSFLPVIRHRLCGVHNEVNKRLKKPLFDCAHVDSAYDCGCGDGDEDEDKADSGKKTPEKKNVVPHDDLTGAEMIRGGRRSW